MMDSSLLEENWNLRELSDAGMRMETDSSYLSTPEQDNVLSGLDGKLSILASCRVIYFCYFTLFQVLYRF